MIAYDRTVGAHDVRLSELDLRCQCLETANYDGVLVWKISDYAERKRQAVEGRVLSLYSQPFYTSRYGYKMCARVYLNGDGSGRNTHLSLFFVVMQVSRSAVVSTCTPTPAAAVHLQPYPFWAHSIWGHSGPLCHALSLLLWTPMRRRRATVAACDSSDTW